MTEIGPDYGNETDEGTVVPPVQAPLLPLNYELLKRIAALMKEEALQPDESSSEQLESKNHI